ncbi:MAG: DUF192 domain-containing protein [Nitrospirae bacterium]|nr:DUF192 domain-containing protein [Nitrospirota bacterium]
MRSHRALMWFIAVWLLAGAVSPAAAAEPTTLRLPTGRSLTLELAATPQQRNIGLMLRPSLAENHGMLFLFPRPDRHGIWMKNMLIPIDILWLDDHKQIIHVETNVPPCRIEPCLVYQPPTPAFYVIELAAGAALRADLRPGTVLSFTAGATAE